MSKEKLQAELDRMSAGKWSAFTVGQLADKVAWMWKWRKITHDEMESMCLQLINIIGMGIYKV